MPSQAPMEPGIIDVSMIQGATWKKTYTLSYKVNPTDTPTPYDLTGCSARMQVRATVYDNGTTAPIDVSTTSSDDGLISIGGSNGQINISLTPFATQKLEFTEAVYDLFVQWPDTEVWKVVKGAVTIDLSSTEPTYGV